MGALPGLIAICILILLLLILTGWGGKCESCKSRNNWLQTRMRTDDHQPHLIFETDYAVCASCGHKEQRDTRTRVQERNPYDAFKNRRSNDEG